MSKVISIGLFSYEFTASELGLLNGAVQAAKGYQKAEKAFHDLTKSKVERIRKVINSIAANLSHLDKEDKVKRTKSEQRKKDARMIVRAYLVKNGVKESTAKSLISRACPTKIRKGAGGRKVKSKKEKAHTAVLTAAAGALNAGIDLNDLIREIRALGKKLEAK